MLRCEQCFPCSPIYMDKEQVRCLPPWSLGFFPALRSPIHWSTLTIMTRPETEMASVNYAVSADMRQISGRRTGARAPHCHPSHRRVRGKKNQLPLAKTRYAQGNCPQKYPTHCDALLKLDVLARTQQ